MRRAHRKAHVIIWLVLTPALAAVLLLALLGRQSEPVNDALPASLTAEQGL